MNEISDERDDANFKQDPGAGAAGPSIPAPIPPEPCPDIGLDPMVGTIHYVCDCGPQADADCVNGDDNNSGTSSSAPWRTYEQARSNFDSLAAGDSIVMCRGGHFAPASSSTNSTRWLNQNCQAANPCVVRDYEALRASV